MHFRIRDFVSQHLHGPRLRRRSRQTRAVRPAKRNEMWYRASLKAIVSELKKTGQVIALAMTSKFTMGATPDLDAVMDRAASRFSNISTVARRLAAAAGARNLASVDEKLAAAIKQSVGVNVAGTFAPSGQVGDAMRELVQENVALIVSIPEQYFARVRDAAEKSDSQSDLAVKIAQIGEQTATRADFIARDQTATMTAAFNRVRQTGVGITKYEWAASAGARPSHAALDGTICDWDEPPMIDGEPMNPGEDIGCLCAAIPVIELGEARAS